MKTGDIVRLKLTGEKVMILDSGFCGCSKKHIRCQDFSIRFVDEYELEVISD